MKVAVFGKPGGGKSTIARQIAEAAGLPLHPLDLLQFSEGGARVPDEVFARRHAALLATDDWVIDGFGTRESFADLLRAADVLVYVERATVVHYWWVTKRLILSPVRKPLGWPEGSPMWRSTLSSYRFLRLSRRFWTPAFRQSLLSRQGEKRVFIVRSQSDVRAMLEQVRAEQRHRTA